ncbi:hypothetical protein K504DRAFT_502566 [Pleomassaria siparia CBS 279.74]|uniref:Uncharacterized protein n=1 Tax=Pleomassaria siparia CBS 279.74 TaxID=1314801 RepID=A0A6G1K7W9_9PLEO|nr:hypothetical protein K504DRAFT_502566 [Pleomassaria siparia CBS 279.74]
MKSFAIATTFCTLASALPSSLAPWAVQAPPQPGTQMYQFQAKSSVTAVNNQWLALKTGSTQYTLANTQAAGTKFFTGPYKSTGTNAIFNADDTRQVALQGTSNVLLNVVDVTNPRTDTIPEGTLMEWATFTMDGAVLGVNDGSTLKNRSFVAIQGTGGYSVAFYDGASTTTTPINLIQLSIVKTT